MVVILASYTYGQRTNGLFDVLPPDLDHGHSAVRTPLSVQRSDLEDIERNGVYYRQQQAALPCPDDPIQGALGRGNREPDLHT